MKWITDIAARVRWAFLVNRFNEITGSDPIEYQILRVASPDEAPIGSSLFLPVNAHYIVSRVLYRGKDIYGDGRVYWVFCIKGAPSS